jgi:hypothetical protein
MAKQQHEETKTSHSVSLYDSYIKGKELYYLMGILLAVIYFVFNDFINLKKIYLFKDI